MMRRVAAVVLGVCLCPAWLAAQTPQAPAFTVTAPSAAVHAGPSTGSPVVSRVPRGTVLEVVRDLGGWVRVSWADAPDGAGYVHQSMGSLTGRAPQPATGAPPAAARPAYAPAGPARATPLAAGVPATSAQSSVPPSSVYVVAPTHVLGFGGLFSGAPADGFGVTSRVWSRKRVGVHVEASRSALNRPDAAERMTSVQFAPSLTYWLADRVTDNVWLRPYVGGGASLQRSTLRSIGPGDPLSDPETRLGWRAFGGSEVTLPAVPRFAVAADVGYLWIESPFADYESGGLGFALSAHWYVK